MSLDLGNLLGNLGGAYINARWGGNSQPASFPPLNSIIGIPDSGPAPIPPQQNTLGLPGIDIVPDSPGRGWLYDPSANCGAGKWIRKRRRRHRNLATRGDIKDLSALKGVIGNGKLLEAWIATHS